jgi:hypothetical protein
MSSSANTLSTLNGFFKVVYASKLENLIPEAYKMLTLVPFSGREAQIGKQYSQPVILGQEHGITFAGPDEDAYALNAAVAGKTKEAIVKGYQMVLRTSIGYAAISRSVGSEKAFGQATKVIVENMMRSFSKKLEIRLMYGQMGLGTVASKAGNNLVITTAEFAAGIWTGAEDMILEIRNPSGVLQQTASISGVDLVARQLSLDAAVAAGVAPSDVLWEKGSYGKEMPGLHKILTNSGVLFDIDASQYSLWKANSYSASSAALSFEKIQEAIALPVAKGLDGKLVLLISPKTWATLMTDEAALRKYDYSYDTKVSENGSRQIKFYSQNGEVEIVPSNYVKEGYAYLVSTDEMMRIGSTDITFKRPGSGDEFFRELNDNAGVELRAYSDQSLFCYAPGKNCIIINIVN